MRDFYILFQIIEYKKLCPALKEKQKWVDSNIVCKYLHSVSMARVTHRTYKSRDVCTQKITQHVIETISVSVSRKEKYHFL